MRTKLSLLWALAALFSLITACSPLGLSVEKNPAQARELYQQGLNYSAGRGVEEDYALALQRFRQAARRGSVPAHYMIGMSYYTGRGTGRDVYLAHYWLQKSANKGHAPSQYQLATIYLRGDGFEQDKEWAVLWLGRAAQQGYKRAQLDLAMCWLDGIGVPQNKAHAYALLDQARRHGDARATELEAKLRGQLSRSQRNQARVWLRTQESDHQAPLHLYAQVRLQQLGQDPGPIDGLWGGHSQQALIAFQEKHKLPAHGKIDKASIEALRDRPLMERLRDKF